MWNMIGNSVLHIEMRRWADVMGKWALNTFQSYLAADILMVRYTNR